MRQSINLMPTSLSNCRSELSYLQLAVVLFNSNDLHLQVDAQWQLLDSNTRSGWLEVAEVLTVDTVELGELGLHVGQKDGGLNYMLQRRVGGVQDVADILNHLLSLLSNGGIGRQWLVLWGVWNLTRNVDKTIDLDSLGVRGSWWWSGSGFNWSNKVSLSHSECVLGST